MAVRTHLVAALGAWAAFAALVLAPSVAAAHAGHAHVPQVIADHAAHQAASHAPEIQKQHSEDLTAAVASEPADSKCGGRTCCSKGPCTGCNGFVLMSAQLALPPMFSSRLALRDLPQRSGAEPTRLRRPPKSLA